MQRLYINPKYASRLDTAGLHSFESIIGMADQGELVATDTGRNTYKVGLGDQTYYLKSVAKPIIAPSIESLLTLRKPHHYCWRELKQVDALAAHGISVVEVAAAGESSSWGILNYSFLLTPEVEGPFLHVLFEDADHEERISLLSSLGSLSGRLHTAGFFSPVRMKDVIVDTEGRYVMIDRETRKPGSRKYSQRKALQGLRRTIARQARDGIHWNRELMHAYLAAYLSDAPSELAMSEEALDQRLIDMLN